MNMINDKLKEQCNNEFVEEIRFYKKIKKYFRPQAQIME